MPDEQNVTRKLRAILSADVKGYSILMADNEVATIQTLKDYRKIMSERIEMRGGRVVDAVGDNLLAEFGSAVDAVQCAVDVQKELKDKNKELPENKRLQFRIGINIGDVIQDGNRIFGDGVNITARIEGLAEAGGVCISRSTYDHIRTKLNLGYEYLGEHSVKNISQPVRVYKVLMGPMDAGKIIGEDPIRLKMKWFLPAAVVAAIIMTSITWYYIQSITKPDVEPASVENMALPLPDKPSIAVLPFDNMSDDPKQEYFSDGITELSPKKETDKPSIAILPFENLSNDPEQEYFSDGMTDELISDLAKIKNILVISRNSSFTYKGKSAKVHEIAKDLNVRYILEGSVQKSGNKVRIRAQLIDGKTDHHVWSESYNGLLDDIFMLQDQITTKIVTALSVKLTSNEQDRITNKGTDNILAYDVYLKGFEHYSRMTGENILKAINYYRQAAEIDPKFNRAYSGLAAAHYISISFNSSKEPERNNVWEIITVRNKARHYLNLAMKNPTWEAYRVAAYMDIERKRFDKAVSFAEKAVLMAPNEYLANIAMGHVLNCVGRSDEALEFLDKAMLLDPRFLDILLVEKGKAYYLLGDFEKAIESIQRGLTLNPELTYYSPFEAASYAFLGKEKEAENAWNKFADRFPDKSFLTTKHLYYIFSFKDHKIFDRFIDGLNKAGFVGNPSDYNKVNKKNKLSGQKIKELLFGKIATGNITAEMEFSYRWNAVGDLEFSIPSARKLEKGKSWIEGDSLCIQYEHFLEGISNCWDCYYNTEGSDVENNQYLLVGDFALNSISIGN